MSLIRTSDWLAREAGALTFGPPVACVYNPLVYASALHHEYLKRFGRAPKEALFVGMNPGPFGMAQTGVPFGDAAMVRDWMGIRGKVGRPEREHPKRPIWGMDCPRSEVSGTRFWGWARDRFGPPENFFARFLVWNYCPLCFMAKSGANVTPDKLPARESRPLFEICDEALASIAAELRPKFVIGIGKFAEDRIRAVIDEEAYTAGRILHPSPASPAANKDWAGEIEGALRKLGIEI
jgi:single-strand selective monofunctional uracil DNA glycosylase